METRECSIQEAWRATPNGWWEKSDGHPLDKKIPRRSAQSWAGVDTQPQTDVYERSKSACGVGMQCKTKGRTYSVGRFREPMGSTLWDHQSLSKSIWQWDANPPKYFLFLGSCRHKTQNIAKRVCCQAYHSGWPSNDTRIGLRNISSVNCMCSGPLQCNIWNWDNVTSRPMRFTLNCYVESSYGI